jgi:hypothetical protein
MHVYECNLTVDTHTHTHTPGKGTLSVLDKDAAAAGCVVLRESYALQHLPADSGSDDTRLTTQQHTPSTAPTTHTHSSTPPSPPTPTPFTWKRYLMKIRLLLVVSSSVSRMHPRTPQLMASLASRCANSLATLRSLLVSRRWMMEYCLPKQSSNVACEHARVRAR